METYNESALNKWLLQTSSEWEDVKDVMNLTGFSMIDNDHMQLIRYILRLNEIIELFNDDEINLNKLSRGKELLQDFLSYTLYHFGTEEKILTQFKMDDLEKQMSQHRLIVNKIRSAIDSFNSGKLMITAKFKMELLDWVIDHVNNVDGVTFKLNNFRSAFKSARTWDEVAILVENTGLNFVDQEHRHITKVLFTTIDKLETHQIPVEEIKQVFIDLIKLFKLHFDHEESFIYENNLKNLNEMKSSHKYFISMLEEIMTKSLSDKNFEISEVKVETLIWWIGHINGIDHNTFNINEWARPIFETSSKAEELIWLVEKTGDELIDSAHSEVISLGIEINELMINKPNKSEIIEKLTKLNAVIKSHFAYEENLMSKMDKMSTSYHKDEHKRIQRYLNQTLKYIKEGRFNFDSNFKTKFIDWWINHTNYIDIKTFGLK